MSVPTYPHPEAPCLPGDRINVTGPLPQDPAPIPVGAWGTVSGVTFGLDMWQIDVRWDETGPACGRSLALLGTDPFVTSRMSVEEARGALGDTTSDHYWKSARQALYERLFTTRDWWALEALGSHCATPSSAALSDRALGAIMSTGEGEPRLGDWHADPRWQALRYRLARLAVLANTIPA